MANIKKDRAKKKITKKLTTGAKTNAADTFACGCCEPVVMVDDCGCMETRILCC